ncbi:MAG: hypothetical protein KDK78_04225 [Chlamydiia bacterium]|nr:hypothetical protein [Chlamydiia bacterium]
MTDEIDVDGVNDCADIELLDVDESAEGELGLEELTLLMTTQHVTDLEDKIKKEFEELKERQAQVRYLHKLLKLINAQGDGKNGFDANKDPELRQLLDQAEVLGIELPSKRYIFDASERQRLVENIRMTCEDLNMQNELQMQTITRLTNERYETHQMARAIQRPLHEAKVNKARGIAGR